MNVAKHTKIVFDFYYQVFDVKLTFNPDHHFTSSVHYGQNYPLYHLVTHFFYSSFWQLCIFAQALWMRKFNQVIYGDGGQLFEQMTGLDVSIFIFFILQVFVFNSILSLQFILRIILDCCTWINPCCCESSEQYWISRRTWCC